VRNWNMDEAGLDRLLELDSHQLRIGHKGELTLSASRRPLTASERLALHRRLARALELLARTWQSRSTN
jgi:hypothetical protein